MIPFSIDFYQTLDSTNTHAIRCIREAFTKDRDDFYNLKYKVIVCDQQTRGRGLIGHQWVSPLGNLYMSVLMPIDFADALSSPSQFSIASGLGLERAILRACRGANIHVKWPNDILIDDQKIAGILVEVEDPFVIIGLGVNCVSAPKLDIPTTHMHAHGASFVENSTFITWVLEALSEVFELWRSKGFEDIQSLWYEQCWEVGQEVTIHGVSGTFLKLGERGEMILDCKGTLKSIVSPSFKSSSLVAS